MQSRKKILRTVLTLVLTLSSLFVNAYGGESSLKLKIMGRVCEVMTADNRATIELINKLPMTVSMQELNGNEKHGELDSPLPVDAMKPHTIHKGDVLLWGSTTLVLFYKTFLSNYSYTPIGRLEDPSCLDAIANKETISVEVLP